MRPSHLRLWEGGVRDYSPRTPILRYDETPSSTPFLSLNVLFFSHPTPLPATSLEELKDTMETAIWQSLVLTFPMETAMWQNSALVFDPTHWTSGAKGQISFFVPLRTTRVTYLCLWLRVFLCLDPYPGGPRDNTVFLYSTTWRDSPSARERWVYNNGVKGFE